MFRNFLYGSLNRITDITDVKAVHKSPGSIPNFTKTNNTGKKAYTCAEISPVLSATLKRANTAYTTDIILKSSPVVKLIYRANGKEYNAAVKP